MFAGVGALAVVGTIAAAVFILPIGTWRDQDDDISQRQAQLDELRRVNTGNQVFEQFSRRQRSLSDHVAQLDDRSVVQRWFVHPQTLIS
jgi:hypothetical protein